MLSLASSAPWRGRRTAARSAAVARGAWLYSLAWVLGLWLALPPLLLAQMDLDEQVRQIAAQLRCPVCQNLSVADSPSETAQQMRGVMRDQLEAGKTPEEILAYFRSKYGDWILLSPRPRGLNLLVWIGPFAGVAANLAMADADQVAQWITEARKRLAAQPTGPQQAPKPGGTVTGTVTLAPSLRTEVPSGGALFIIARQGNGPPLAVKRIPNPSFPVSFSLGPENQMLSGTPLEGEVTLVARFKRDGTAGPPTPGDLEGRPSANPIQMGQQGVEIVLDKVY